MNEEHRPAAGQDEPVTEQPAEPAAGLTDDAAEGPSPEPAAGLTVDAAVEPSPGQLTAPVDLDSTLPLVSYPPPIGSPFVHQPPPSVESQRVEPQPVEPMSAGAFGSFFSEC